MRQKKEFNFKQWLVWTLRRASYRWPPRNEAIRRVTIDKETFLSNPGIEPEKVSQRIKKFFRCNLCGKGYPRKNGSLDHVVPIIDPEKGFTDWNDVIPRIFPEAEGWQLICNSCHDEKTGRERVVRTKSRRERKTSEENKKASSDSGRASKARRPVGSLPVGRRVRRAKAT